MNKRLIGIIAALALVVGGSLVYSNLTKQETKTERRWRTFSFRHHRCPR